MAPHASFVLSRLWRHSASLTESFVGNRDEHSEHCNVSLAVISPDSSFMKFRDTPSVLANEVIGNELDPVESKN